jgi:ABC-type nickel/cobalt efflux system permease component RcnA
VHVTVRDLAFVDRPGWRELAAEDSANAMVVSGPTEHSKDALAYGNSRGDAPPRVDHADLTFRLAHGEAPRSHSLDPVPRLSVDPSLTRLAFALKDRSGSRAFAGIAVALATGLGAAHAMSPGHGKALAAATLVGKRARPANALLFGIAVAASHTAVVLVVGALALAIERSLGSDRVMRGLELASSIAVAGLGMVQLTSRWAELSAHSAGLHGHPSSTERGRGSVATIGALSGLAPCPTALAVWLSAVALHRVALGLVLVAAFSLGVATTLTAVGLLVVLVRSLVDRKASPPGRVVRCLPLVSSACVTAIGILLCASVWSSGAAR